MVTIKEKKRLNTNHLNGIAWTFLLHVCILDEFYSSLFYSRHKFSIGVFRSRVNTQWSRPVEFLKWSTKKRLCWNHWCAFDELGLISSSHILPCKLPKLCVEKSSEIYGTCWLWRPTILSYWDGMILYQKCKIELKCKIKTLVMRFVVIMS